MRQQRAVRISAGRALAGRAGTWQAGRPARWRAALRCTALRPLRRQGPSSLPSVIQPARPLTQWAVLAVLDADWTAGCTLTR